MNDTKKSLDKLVTAINSDPSVKKTPRTMVLYFDESQGMTTDYGVEDELANSAYQILCRALNRLHEHPLFTVFLSTSSNLSSFSPSQRLWYSARGRNAQTDNVQPPFVELPFDTWKETIIIREDQKTLADVCETEFMARFGRPL